MRKAWSEKDTFYLKQAMKDKSRFISEISKEMGKNENLVRYHARKLGWSGKKNQNQNQRYFKWNTLYSLDFIKKVMEYFVAHSAAETRKHFSISEKAFKSIMTRGYQQESLSHLRKDARRKDKWTIDDYLFVARYSGVMPRDWIAKKIDRASARNIKEHLKNKMNAQSRWLNGLPYTIAKEFWPDEKTLLKVSIKTEAGPTHFKYRIIQWHDALSIAKKYDCDETTLACLDALRKFSEFIHGTKSKGAIKRRFSKALSESKNKELGHVKADSSDRKRDAKH